MIAEANIYAVLAATADVTNLCGQRIYPDEAPTGTALPYLVFQRISTDPAVTHEQMSAGTSRLDGCRIQLTAIAASPAAANALLYAARVAVESSSGLQAIWLDERSIGREDGAQAHGRSGDFLVWKEPY